MEKYFEEKLCDSKIVEINRICDLVQIVFELPNGEKVHLHEQCFLRVFDSSGVLVICSLNMLNRSPNYRRKWYKKYDWTKVGSTVFDDAVKDYKHTLLNTKISNVKFEASDLFLFFDNGMRMDVLVAVTKYDDEDYSENYRIFEKNRDDKEHFVK